MVTKKRYIIMSCNEIPENVKLIDKARKIENRSRAYFIRIACNERARRIIMEEKKRKNERPKK